MSVFNKILFPETVECGLFLESKKQILEEISQLIFRAVPTLKPQDILFALQQRERLGSTAVGHQMALPHARVSGLAHPVCALITLDPSVEYDSADQMVKLVCGLVIPKNAAEEHLDIISALIAALRNKSFREKILQATTNEDLFETLIQ